MKNTIKNIANVLNIIDNLADYVFGTLLGLVGLNFIIISAIPLGLFFLIAAVVVINKENLQKWIKYFKTTKQYKIFSKVVNYFTAIVLFVLSVSVLFGLFGLETNTVVGLIGIFTSLLGGYFEIFEII